MNQAYEQIARQVVCLYKNLYQGTAVRQYTSYGMYMMRASLPKLTYYNTYEPQYTKFTVKYNAPIVGAMILTTAILISRRNGK